MPAFQNDSASIHYEVKGEGFPVLLLAPGGMRSSIPLLQNMPWNPIDELSADFQTIGMDQRNAGKSVAPIGPDDGWASYTRDQLALLDHLGIERAHVLGCCIGGSFILGLLEAAPERIASAVLVQPIGATAENAPEFQKLFSDWAADVKQAQPDVPDVHWDSYGERMFGGDFVYNVSRDFVRGCQTPMLVLMGNDLYHPAETSREIVSLAPNAELVESWKEGDAVAAGLASVRSFLQRHS